MTRPAKALSLLPRGPKKAVAKVLIATLGRTTPYEREAVVEALLATRLPEAHLAAVRHLHRCPSAILAALADRSLNLDQTIKSALGESGDSQAVHNALVVVRERGEPQFLGLLCDLLLHSPDEAVRQSTGDAFLDVVLAHGEQGQPDHSRMIDESVARALDDFPRHRHRGCLLAAAIASAKAGPKLASLLDDAHSPASLSLRSIVRDLHEPLVRRNLLLWLTVPALSGAAQRTIHHLRGPEHFSDLLCRGHLLRDERVRRAIRGIEKPRRCVPPPAVAARMRTHAQQWLPDWVSALRLQRSCLVSHLREMIVLPSRRARLKAVFELSAWASICDEAKDALTVFRCDRDRTVARAARLLVDPHAECHEQSETPLIEIPAEQFATAGQGT